MRLSKTSATRFLLRATSNLYGPYGPSWYAPRPTACTPWGRTTTEESNASRTHRPVQFLYHMFRLHRGRGSRRRIELNGFTLRLAAGNFRSVVTERGVSFSWVTRYPPPTGRHCTRCREWLPFSAFRPNLRLKSGWSSWCKALLDCRRVARLGSTLRKSASRRKLPLMRQRRRTRPTASTP